MNPFNPLLLTSILLTFWCIINPLQALEVSKEEYEAIQKFEELKKTNPAAAEKFLNEVLLENRTATLLFQAALFAVEHNHLNQAIEHFSEVISLDENYEGALMNRGQLYAGQGNYKNAIDDLIKSIEKEGMDGTTLKILSQCYMQMGNVLPAETTLRWALMYKPDDLENHLLLASLVLDQGRYTEAAAIARNSINLGNLDIRLWRIMISAYISLEKYDQALDAIETTKLVSTEISDDLILTLGQIYLQKGMSKEAADQFLDVHKRKSLNKEQLTRLAKSLLYVGDGENAVKFCKLLREISPNKASTLYLSAKAANLIGDTTKAVSLAEKCVSIDSGYGKAFLLLGSLYLEQEKMEDALEALRTARAFSDLRIQALRLELELWLKREDWAESLSVLENLSQLDAGGKWDGLIHSITSLVN